MAERVLVTGASAGFGRLIVETLRKQGHVVVASMRGVADRNREAAAALASAGAHVVEIDVSRSRTGGRSSTSTSSACSG